MSFEELRSGDVLAGRYRIVGALGEGGMGSVYRAEHLTMGKAVAVKVLQGGFTDAPTMRRRFEREAHALAALSHPHIVSIVDYGFEGSMPYLVMELLEGQTLRAALGAGPLAPARALDITRQVLGALAFAHGQNIVHRDLKPENVVLRTMPDGTEFAALLDFGFAKFTQGPQAAQLTPGDVVLGTPSYMAPEQATGQAISGAADLYAVGIVLFEMLAGRPPFEGSALEKIRHHLKTPAPALAERRPELAPSAALEELIATALRKDPTERFSSADAFLRVIEELPEPAARTLAPVAGPPPDPGPTMELRTKELAKLAIAGDGRTMELSTSDLSPHEATEVHRAPTGRWARWGVAMAVLALLVALAVVVAMKYPRARPAPVADPAELPAVVEPVEPVEPVGPAEPAEAATVDRGCADAAADLLPSFRDPNTPWPAPRDPWIDAPPDESMAEALERLERGDPPSERTLRSLRAQAERDVEDPRASLVLARAYLARGWRRSAALRYLEAFERDPSVRGAPHMREDLLAIAARGLPRSQGAHTLLSIYGTEALDPIEEALASDTLPEGASVRLRRLRGALRCADR